jgi:O-antigen/teichoic acid export membrane protein
MSIASGALATGASRAYLTALGILILPLYLQRLGAEAFGLVAWFFMLQVWFQLLDMGLTATLAREAARFRAGARTATEMRQLIRVLERVFLIVLLAAGAGLFLCADLIGSRWLKPQGLLNDQVARAIELMALCLTVRLLGELYRAALAGFERQVWLAGCNVVFGSLRLLGVLPFLTLVGASPASFFTYQLGIGALETVVLLTAVRRLLPAAAAAGPTRGAGSLRSVLGFSAAMAAAGVIWVAVTQMDKLLLSGLLTLAEYGALSLAVAAAAGVLLATSSLADTLVPRLTRLTAQGDSDEVLRLYHQASQWTAVIACSVAAVLAAHARPVLWAWTGDAELAQAAAPVLALYALGNAAMAIAALPFYLQLAQGRLRLHLVGTGLMVAVLVPAVLWATGRWGAVGAAAVWLGVNTAYLLAWTPVAHHYFAPDVHRRWVLSDLAPVILVTTVAALASSALTWPSDRIATSAQLLLVAVLVLLVSAAASPSIRQSVQCARQRWA